MKLNKVLQTLICLILIAGCTSVATPTPTLPASPRPSTATPEPTVPPTPTRTRLPWRLPTPTEAEAPAPSAALPTRIPETNYLRAGQPLPDNLAVIGPENAARLSLLAVWGKGKIYDLTYSLDGSRVAALTSLGLFIYNGDNYELIEFREMFIPGQENWISPDLQYIAAKDGWALSLWSAATGKQIAEWQSVNGYPLEGFHGFDVWGFTQQNHLIVSLSDGENYMKVMIYDPATDGWTETGGKDPIDSLAVSADGATMAAGIYSGLSVNEQVPAKIALWRLDRPDAPIVHDLADDGVEGFEYINRLAISPDGSFVALNSYGLRVLVYSTADQKLLHTLNTPEQTGRSPGWAAPVKRSGPGAWNIQSMTFSPDGQRLAVLNGFGVLMQYDVQSGDPIAYSSIADGGRIQYSPSGETIVQFDDTASFLDVKRNNWVFTLPEHTGGIRALDFSPDGKTLAYGGDDTLVWLRSVQSGQVQKAYAGHIAFVTQLVYAPDGNTIVTGSPDRTIRLWNVHRGSGFILWEADDWIEQLAISPDGKYVAYNCYECAEAEFIRISDDAYFPFDSYNHENVFFFVNEQTLVVPEGGWENGDALSFIKIGDAEPENTLSLPPFYAPCFALQPVRKIIATCTKDLVRISNVHDGATILEASTQVDIGELQTIKFSPDGSLILATGTYGTGVWDSAIAKLLQIYPFYILDDSPSYDFSPDGTLLAYYGEYDGLIYIYGVLNSAPSTH